MWSDQQWWSSLIHVCSDLGEHELCYESANGALRLYSAGLIASGHRWCRSFKDHRSFWSTSMDVGHSLVRACSGLHLVCDPTDTHITWHSWFLMMIAVFDFGWSFQLRYRFNKMPRIQANTGSKSKKICAQRQLPRKTPWNCGYRRPHLLFLVLTDPWHIQWGA